jgi:hypothetical protein
MKKNVLIPLIAIASNEVICHYFERELRLGWAIHSVVDTESDAIVARLQDIEDGHHLYLQKNAADNWPPPDLSEGLLGTCRAHNRMKGLDGILMNSFLLRVI